MISSTGEGIQVKGRPRSLKYSSRLGEAEAKIIGSILSIHYSKKDFSSI